MIYDWFCYELLFFARTLASGVISGSRKRFQNLIIFSIKNLSNEVSESISKLSYPLKIISTILKYSAALSPFKILMKRSIVTLVIKSV